MLRIKRVPTVVSNYQKEEAGEAARPTGGGCGHSCLKQCCIQGTYYIHILLRNSLNFFILRSLHAI